MKYQLLCTFTNQANILTSLRDILSTYEIAFNKIYIFENYIDRSELFFTYNIIHTQEFINNTILIHRKKESNTFYTINALNELIKTINNGILDITYKIDWDNYQNMMILYSNNELRRIRLNLKEVFNPTKNF